MKQVVSPGRNTEVVDVRGGRSWALAAVESISSGLATDVERPG